MPFDFADLKSLSRRVVHTTLGVSAFYQDDSMSAPEPIRARWHNKINRFGDLQEQGYAELVEGIDRIILFPQDNPTVNYSVGGVVTFPKWGISFRLQSLEPSDGPDQAVWQVIVLRP